MSNCFLDRYEEITYEKLRAVCEPYNAHVFSKVRLADILPVNKSGLSDNDFRFALQSHTDFLVTNSKYEVEFCVEFDGSSHNKPEQIRRDNQKNALFDYFKKTLLRITSKYLDPKYRGLDLLTYFVEVWFIKKHFYESQERGDLPFDEIFDPAFIFDDGKQQFPYWLSLEQQVIIQKLFEEGRVAQPAPSDWVGIDSDNNYHCLTWLLIKPDTAIYVKIDMRNQRFCGVITSDLLVMIAVCELYEELKILLSGKLEAPPRSALEQELDFYRQSYKLCQTSSCEILGSS
ncbi:MULTISPECIES: DUF2726 domain-containing protein [Kamptonema]|uniref:DUF2726 domain-containing protein n=1 Tax=Kamptonema TaxID=1501433 RepID=UPI0001DAD1C4|nr:MULTISPECIES: DUF2726 domain-containing protein [Kamptonema]CBN55826.1 hypothetical protein OSCI_2500003 [Kamptonema sp. PCC 6506]